MQAMTGISLRNRILIAIVLIHVLVVGVLTVLLSLDAKTREGKSESLRKEAIASEERLVRRLLSGLIDSSIDESTLVKTLLHWPLWGEVEDAVIINTEVDEEFTINPKGARDGFLGSPEIRGGLFAGRARQRIEQALDEEALRTYGDWVAAPITYSQQGQKIKWGGIYFKPRPPDTDLSLTFSSVRNVVFVSFLGTALLIGITYVLLSRLVLRPVDRLQRASRRIAQKDFSVQIPTDGLEPEMAGLVRGFNAMAADVRDYHHHLEERIREETEKVERTQKGLLIAQRLAATGTLAAGIAHEINNPLGGMINMTRSLISSREITPEKRREYLELIATGLRRIEDTVRRVLTFSPRQLSPQVFSVFPLIDQALALVRHRLAKDGIRLEYDPPKGSEANQVFGDSGEVQQALLNLLLNSVDALRGRPDPVIRVSLSTDEAGIQIAIADTGVGMSPEQIDRAFDLFFSTKEVGEGTGLGLSMVYHIIVENHGGAVDLSSEVGRGTKVRVTLPRHPVESDPAARGKRDGVEGAGSQAPEGT